MSIYHTISPFERQLLDEAKAAEKLEENFEKYRRLGMSPTVAHPTGLSEFSISLADDQLLIKGLTGLVHRLEPYPVPLSDDDIVTSAAAYGDYDEADVMDWIEDGWFPSELLNFILAEADGEDSLSIQKLLPVVMLLYFSDASDDDTLGRSSTPLFSDEEILQYLLMYEEDLDAENTSTEQAVAALAMYLILDKHEDNNHPGVVMLESRGVLLNHLTLSRLQRAAAEVDLDPSGGKPEIIVRLCEHILSDVIAPCETTNEKKCLEDRAEAAAIQSLKKTNLASYLQTAQILGKTALTSACWALVRENYNEFLSDPDILKLFEEEADKWKLDESGENIWKPLVNAVSKKRKRTVKIDCHVKGKSERKKRGKTTCISKIKQSSITSFFPSSV